MADSDVKVRPKPSFCVRNFGIDRILYRSYSIQILPEPDPAPADVRTTIHKIESQMFLQGQILLAYTAYVSDRGVHPGRTKHRQKASANQRPLIPLYENCLKVASSYHTKVRRKERVHNRPEVADSHLRKSSPDHSRKRRFIAVTVSQESYPDRNKTRKTSHTHEGAVKSPTPRIPTEFKLAKRHALQEWGDDMSRRRSLGAQIRKNFSGEGGASGGILASKEEAEVLTHI